MTIVGALRGRLYRKEIAKRIAEHDEPCAAEQRQAIQLSRLNREWERATRLAPYFKELRRQRKLPERFGSLAEFSQCAPVTTREALQNESSRMICTGRPPDLLRMTGGSTSKPVQIPSWKREFEIQRWDLWVARSWYGIRPSDRLFLIWGHSHLLGTGWRGWLKARRLEISDRLLGYRRFSAYDLRYEKMRASADELLRFRPRYVLGYSVALDLFESANRDRREELRRAGVQLVIATAEAFPSSESSSRLEELFGCSVAMEYGAVEAGLPAHTHPSGGYSVFWRNNLLEIDSGADSGRLLVTSLYPRCIPLLRYEIGDEIELGFHRERSQASVLSFERVVGRCNDYVVLDDGTKLHSEIFSHVVRPCAAVRGFQIAQRGGELRLRYIADTGLAREDELGIRRRFAKIHPKLEGIEFERVERLEQSVAGKTRMVVQET